MKGYLTLVFAALALGVSVYAVTKPAPSLGTVSVSKLVHDKLQAQAKAAGVTILSDKVLAPWQRGSACSASSAA